MNNNEPTSIKNITAKSIYGKYMQMQILSTEKKNQKGRENWEEEEQKIKYNILNVELAIKK